MSSIYMGEHSFFFQSVLIKFGKVLYDMDVYLYSQLQLENFYIWSQFVFPPLGSGVASDNFPGKDSTCYIGWFPASLVSL